MLQSDITHCAGKAGSNMNIKITKSKRKTISITIKSSDEISVRAPKWMKKADIQTYIDNNMKWIEKHLEKAREAERKAENVRTLTELELLNLFEQAKLVIPKRVEMYAGQLGLNYGRITIRNQRTRWGSCSSKGNLNFNVALMRVPLEVMDYVIVHELCHLIEMNHSSRFWGEVAKVLPDYKTQVMWLKTNGEAVLKETGVRSG